MRSTRLSTKRHGEELASNHWPAGCESFFRWSGSLWVPLKTDAQKQNRCFEKPPRPNAWRSWSGKCKTCSCTSDLRWLVQRLRQLALAKATPVPNRHGRAGLLCISSKLHALLAKLCFQRQVSTKKYLLGKGVMLDQLQREQLHCFGSTSCTATELTGRCEVHGGKAV